MPPLPEAIILVLAPFAPLFSPRAARVIRSWLLRAFGDGGPKGFVHRAVMPLGHV
jgi:hypothetical protein